VSAPASGAARPAMTAIAALDPARVIGRDGSLPWHLPDDLRLFKQLTLGHTIVMGRRTWDSLPRKPLPGRRHVVLSRTLADIPAGVVVAADPAGIERAIAGDSRVFLIGGAALYQCLLGRCDELVLSHVRRAHQGDTWFPAYENDFEAVESLAEHPDFHTVRYRRRAQADGT